VWYEYSEFIDRDIDFVPDALETLCSKMSVTNVRHIYRNCLDQAEEDALNEYQEYLLTLPVRQRPKQDKTIWASFSKQMEDLMEEMAESLLKCDPNEPLPLTENIQPTDLHFIRCIKPRPKPLNKEDRPGLFVHTMTLQQMTYMGVLESVKLKQDNFPFRKKYEEFYADYELLSEHFAVERFD
jgi:myosin heavy subunit